MIARNEISFWKIVQLLVAHSQESLQVMVLLKASCPSSAFTQFVVASIPILVIGVDHQCNAISSWPFIHPDGSSLEQMNGIWHFESRVKNGSNTYFDVGNRVLDVLTMNFSNHHEYFILVFSLSVQQRVCVVQIFVVQVAATLIGIMLKIRNIICGKIIDGLLNVPGKEKNSVYGA